MLVICGPSGVGKTTLAEVLARHTGATMLGDVRMPGEIAAALSQAELASVVAVVRSGESLGLFAR
jgi:ABC-type cobalamin/Fe3+-siderophores transport system ATPase subunit